MKKMDLHIHTVSTKRDKPFAFSIEKLKGYVIQEKVDLIAITNHNLFDAQQFSDITNALPIKVFPGIEVDIEGGHLIVITDPSDIDDFTEKCAKVYRLNETSEDSYISEAQFMEIFNDLGKYILIPHYEKEPKLPLERVPQISPYIKCGEACSAKKFIYMQSRSEKLVPVLFSDWRVEEKAQFPLGRQTYIDIDDVNMMSLKYALTDARALERSKRMMQIIDTAIDLMRRKHKKGEFYYWILYYAYLSPQQCENAGAILQSLESKGISISLRTYYVHRDEAIEVLSSILWGYTSQDCEKITNLLTPD